VGTRITALDWYRGCFVRRPGRLPLCGPADRLRRRGYHMCAVFVRAG